MEKNTNLIEITYNDMRHMTTIKTFFLPEVNLQGLSYGRPGGGSGRKKMQLTFQGSPSVTLREAIKSPDASEIEAKLQEIMKLTDILTIDGRVRQIKF